MLQSGLCMYAKFCVCMHCFVDVCTLEFLPAVSMGIPCSHEVKVDKVVLGLNAIDKSSQSTVVYTYLCLLELNICRAQ